MNARHVSLLIGQLQPEVNHAGVCVQHDGSAERCAECGAICEVPRGGGWAGVRALCPKHYALWAEHGFMLTGHGSPWWPKCWLACGWPDLSTVPVTMAEAKARYNEFTRKVLSDSAIKKFRAGKKWVVHDGVPVLAADCGWPVFYFTRMPHGSVSASQVPPKGVRLYEPAR